MERCLFQTVIFDLSKSGTPENNRIWVNWAKTRRELYWCSWKYLFTEGRHTPETWTAIFFWKCLFLKLWSWISPKAPLSKGTESELFKPWREKNFTNTLEDTFSCKVVACLKLQQQIFFEKVSFSNCDLWTLQK